MQDSDNVRRLEHDLSKLKVIYKSKITKADELLVELRRLLDSCSSACDSVSKIVKLDLSSVSILHSQLKQMPTELSTTAVDNDVRYCLSCANEIEYGVHGNVKYCLMCRSNPNFHSIQSKVSRIKAKDRIATADTEK